MIRAAANIFIVVEIVQDVRSVAIITANRRCAEKFAAPIGMWVSSSGCQLNEAIEDGEFELQFDAVREWLIRYLVVVEICEFENENCGVENDDEDIDEDKVLQDATYRPPLSKGVSGSQ